MLHCSDNVRTALGASLAYLTYNWQKVAIQRITGIQHGFTVKVERKKVRLQLTQKH